MAQRTIKGAVGLNGTVYREGQEKELEAAAKEAGVKSNPAWYGEGDDTAAGPTTATTGALDGLDFASDEAAEAASAAGLSAGDFDGMEPSGAGGFTKADVTKAASKREG